MHCMEKEQTDDAKLKEEEKTCVLNTEKVAESRKYLNRKTEMVDVLKYQKSRTKRSILEKDLCSTFLVVRGSLSNKLC